MLNLRYQSAFKRDYKRIRKRGYDIRRLENIIEMLAKEQALPKECRDHDLGGNWSGFRECHIEPDWLLVYTIDHNDLVLILSRTGSHSDLFG
ncbi:type II toxin-antitoxin system YafQ family toxin [Pyramidobacter sp.]|uniref:type II toxin-antitoxin system YafQ family toxin n=1 Tax=Pyramidobacter sp. TaxID=1943581 RepID=UPI0025F03AEE|nr:type II toxin-antitoxin system YafQ family toxin [Pyramidobacter sp.]MCI7404311.1 type II toxin-antitoxin system YafQ family toxin [Pyramidobacter sp.]MDY3212949.1 type II toxin-antitoxin system YafQ family toxin [Pyramidobacter sp.]